ncbi:hypothetical protein A3K63_02205 [Candidatus Micrarchaeota archaeon RBG_16_49_10]|nr:MAG: hypothetical protein A3K63_02205 [Candidatus Micrarchaeota archaeon RBG_16_49_10]
MLVPPSVARYYWRKDVQKALLEAAKDREIAGEYYHGQFDKRPNIIEYPNDIIEMVKKGIIGFHGSVERWSNPMRLESGLPLEDLDGLRSGWDLIIDPDCPDFEIAKVTTKVIADALKDHGMKEFGLKYTGGKSFHIGISFESFPKKVNSKSIELLYQDVGKGILEYLKGYVKSDLREALLVLGSPKSLSEMVKKPISEISDKDGLNPLKIVEIDSMVASSRHMFRLPFSINVKSLLVSVPLEMKDLAGFKKEDARPWKVRTDTPFLRKPKIPEASMLIVEAMDWLEKNKKTALRDLQQKGERAKLKEVPKSYFPPTILKMLDGGLADGRKRTLFVLINFLGSAGWDWEKIVAEIAEWNKRNRPPLADNYIRTQVRWHQRLKESLTPPNYDNPVFYKNVGITPTEEEMRFKNPVNYVSVRLKARKRMSEK